MVDRNFPEELANNVTRYLTNQEGYEFAWVRHMHNKHIKKFVHVMEEAIYRYIAQKENIMSIPYQGDYAGRFRSTLGKLYLSCKKDLDKAKELLQEQIQREYLLVCQEFEKELKRGAYTKVK